MIVNKEKLKQFLIQGDYNKLQDWIKRGFYDHYDIQGLGYCGMCFEKLIITEYNKSCPNGCDLD